MLENANTFSRTKKKKDTGRCEYNLLVTVSPVGLLLFWDWSDRINDSLSEILRGWSLASIS